MTDQISTIPKGWKMTQLGSVMQPKGYIRGPFGSALKRGEMKSSGIPVYEQQNAIYNHRIFRYFIDDNKYKEMSRFTVKPQDILISCSGTLGKITTIRSNDPIGIISQALLILRADDKKIDVTFLSNFLNSAVGQHMLMGASHGSVQVNIAKRSEVEGIELLLPPIDEQKAISAVLSSLDDKIELLGEQNKTLEAAAQTIFKEWFVNFNFPGSTGKMIDSELGEIPEGWRVGKLGEVIEIFDSKRIPLASDVRSKRKGIYPYYGATSIMDYIDDFIFDGTYLLLAEDGSVIDSNGNPVLQYVWGKFWVSNHAHVLQGKNGYSTEMLYVLLKKANITGIVNGAVQLKVNQTNLVNYEIIIPPANLLSEIDNVMQSIFFKIKNIKYQIETLSSLRDALLPKLMKGEVRISGFNN